MEKTIICNKDFNLQTEEGIKHYYVGDKITGADADHWYAKAHCSENTKEAEKAAGRDAIADAVATKAVVLSLSVNGVPNMDTVNKVLKDSDLPKINAVERDAILAADADEKSQAEDIEAATGG